MKMKTVLFAMLAAVLMISACKTVDDLNEVNFDADFKTDLNCVVPPGSFKSGINGAFSASETIDPLSDPNVEKYIDHIKSWNVASITAEIIAVSKPDAKLLNAEIKVFSDDHSALWNIPGMPLAIGQKVTLGNENGQWDEINAILGEKKTFTASINGATDKDDITFTVRVTIKTKVTASVI